MAHLLSGWNHRDVVNFLRHHGFSLVDPKAYNLTDKGSHTIYYVRLSEDGKQQAIVDVQFLHGSATYPERTLETLIRNSQPFYDKKEWRRWRETGGRCCKGYKKEVTEQALPENKGIKIIVTDEPIDIDQAAKL